MYVPSTSAMKSINAKGENSMMKTVFCRRKGMKKYSIIGILILLGYAGFAQQAKRCANDYLFSKLAQKYPAMLTSAEADREHFKAILENRTPAAAVQKQTAQVTIPVVFHIVLNEMQLKELGGEEGVALRIDSQMTVLNREYNAQGLDRADIPSVFQPLYGDAQIRFGLALRKPDGTEAKGYEIVTTTVMSYSVENGTTGSFFAASDAKYASTGGADAWDPTRYLNIWIVNFTERGLLGICPPMSWVSTGFPINEVGPAINYKAFGKQGPGQTSFLAGYNGGRTLVHEIGHFFELYHIWGNTSVGAGNCTDDDFIDDTPRQKDANTVCPSFPKENCNNTTGGEMFMNFMDYVEDHCYKMFTKQQAALMSYHASDPKGNAYSLSLHPELLRLPSDTTGEELAFSILPNPSEGQLFITLDNQRILEHIQIVNGLGQIVRTIAITDKQLKKYNVDIGGMSKGIYYVRCIFASGTLTKKIVLQ